MDNIQTNINYELRERAGVRDWILNYYYDLSIYLNNFGKLTKIILYTDDEYISGLEYFYNDISTGIFSGKDFKSNDKVKKITIDIPQSSYIEYAYGNFNYDYITELMFCLSSGEKFGFSNKESKSSTVTKYFKFYNENHELFGLRMSFGKYLTFITPIFKLLNNSNLKEEQGNKFLSQEMGKTFGDSKFFTYNNESDNLGRISKISIYHDDRLVKGLKLFYEKGEINHSSENTGQNLKCESLEFNLLKGEEIDCISIRSGDMIDNITIHTNLNSCISSGGHGGSLHVFELNQLKQFYPELKFRGFSGAYSNDFHSLRLVFSK